MMCFKTIAIAMAGLFLSCAILAQEEPMTFEQLAKAEEAIERVYYSHRIWPKDNPQPKPPFEQMVSKAVIEAKVVDSLKKCAALDKYWHRPIQPDQLQAEMDRIVTSTKDPAMLQELFAALNNSPALIAECLARPLLADRKIRNLYAYDQRFHGDLGAETKALRENLTPANFPYADVKRYHPVSIEVQKSSPMSEGGASKCCPLELEAGEFARVADAFPEAGAISQVIETSESFLIRWTRSKTDSILEGGMIAFEKRPFDAWFEEIKSGLSIRIPTRESDFTLVSMAYPSPDAIPVSPDSWKDLHFPDGRDYHTAVWTGTEMIVWGGSGSVATYMNTGGRYSPSTDTWNSLSTGANCPSIRRSHSAVWTGAEMIIWGGYDGAHYLNTGGRYDPSNDSWAATSTGTNCPSTRYNHTAVWTGSEMIVWGGYYYSGQNSGGRYNPSSDTWTTTSTSAGCPSGRYYHTAVWTGTEMIVWGGYGGTVLNTGGRYSPSGNTWTATATGTNCPSIRDLHTAIWTGTEMVIWGGSSGSTTFFNNGGRYAPSTNAWTTVSTGANCPTARRSHTAVWSGTEMIVWGGIFHDSTDHLLGTGGRYYPSSDSWAQTSTSADCPSARYLHTSVWTGTEMVTWGGYGSTAFANTGGRYSPYSDSWTATAMGALIIPGRQLHTAVWTGAEMIIWGGYGLLSCLNSGGVYNPATNSWSATSITSGCPSVRYDHTAVWTGTAMIVWGGYDSYNYLNTGGRYTPVSDSWTATSTGTGCPTSRSSHTAVWTGTEMIIWGGGSNSGGRYNPSSDSWTATSTGAGCPSNRTGNTAVWTGTAMIVWGGYDSYNYFNTGGRYTPVSDSWTATSTDTGCPSGRYMPTAVWTGSEMIIWGGYFYDTSGHYLETGGRYNPLSDSWTATSISAGCPSGRSGHTAIWTGTEMIVWGGTVGSNNYLNTGGRYSSSSDSWTATPTSAGCPTARGYHSAVWTGQSMIIWDGAQAQDGGIFYPNTPPRSLPAFSTSLGGDATFTLGYGETLSLNGSASTDGSNPYTTTSYHDQLDSVVAYEWDLNGDAGFGTQCDSASGGVDFYGPTPAALSDSDLNSMGINSPGIYQIWLRVTDEAGARSCSPVTLTVEAGSPAPGEASSQSVPADAMLASISKTTGDITVAYVAACGTTGHTVYWGNLSNVSGYAWSGSQCASGSAAITFTPPGGGIFFVVVGNNGVDEGSYGKRSSGTERPEASGVGACDYPQRLTGRCDQ